MLIYIVALAAIMYIMQTTSPLRQQEHLWPLALWVFAITLICGLGDMLGGYDRYIYAEIFDGTADDRARGIPLFSTAAFIYAEKEQGYALYNYLLTYVTSNRYIFILVTTLVVYLFLFRHITRYSRYPIMAFFLLFCIYYFFTFTYLRQVLALCIAWFAIPYAIQRRPIPFFAIIILAMLFHNSALLFSGIYFIASHRFSRKQILTVIIWSLILGLTPLSTFLFSTIGGAVNEQKANLSASGANTTRYAYIIEAAFFLYFILKRYDTIGKNRLSLCMMNIALAFVFILCFFVRFLDGGRMSWYFLIGVVCTMAEIMAKDRRKGDIRKMITLVAVLLYLRILWGWGIQLRPYKSFLTDGVRTEDAIWERYEYDHHYDDDKLYRPVFGPMKKDKLIDKY